MIEAINDRMADLQRIKTERALAHLSVGARVIITSSAKPQYLRGQTGEVHDIDGDTVIVCLDKPLGKFRSGHVRCAPSLLMPWGR